MPNAGKIKIFCGKCRQKLDVSDLEPFSLFNCPRCGSAIRVPRRFGHFLLEKVCGNGEFGRTYLASDTMLDRQVCIKVPVDKGEAQQARLRREGRLLSLFNHPGVLPVYDAGELEGTSYLVLRYLDRQSLESRFAAGKLPETEQLLSILGDVCEGLSELHRLGVIHHDVTPGNFLYGGDGDGRLGDLDRAELTEEGAKRFPEIGLSRPAEEECAGHNRYLEYFSPERLLSGREGTAGDVYSFGVSCYELLSGVLPFARGTDEAEMYNIRKRMKHVHLKKRVKMLSRGLAEVLESALEFDGGNRPSAEEIFLAFRNRGEEETAPGAFWDNFF